MHKNQIFWLMLSLGLLTGVAYMLLSSNGEQRVNRQVHIPFSVAEDKEHLILFLGYVGCPTVCPAALKELAELEDQLEGSKHQMVFVNLIDEMPPAAAADYAHSFHPDFRGIQLSASDRQYLVEKLNAFYSEQQPSIGRETGHSDFVYFFTKHTTSSWILQYVVSPTSAERLFTTYNKL